MSWKDDVRPDTEVRDIYDWPVKYTGNGEADDADLAFYQFAAAVQKELVPVYESIYKPLPDDPTLLDEVITNEIDGWAPRVAALMVRAEWYLNIAKKTKWPAKTAGADGKSTTEADRAAIYAEALADVRFVRDELENMLNRMDQRIRWGQSVRKQNASVQ
jgi:hypothetical protein